MKANRLAAEKSPYLLQHAHNPVDWYPWGEEAFAKARRQDKPLLLSIGYSTCHWCHVMERESFENEETALLMNESFVCVKLDREERPDVDKIYMSAVQAMTGQGGWPLNVFLTPELEPFYGGTYFPPQPRWGQPGWPALLRRVAALWKEQRPQLQSDASRLAAALRSYAAAAGVRAAPQASWLKAAAAAYEQAFDERHKGFGGAPKFPMPVSLAFLLRHHARTGSARSLAMTVDTLKAMAAGGVFDQVGGGFHRYATDAQWRVPHFEKMLYDNAQLAAVACEAFQVTGDRALAEIARRTLDYLLRDLRHPEGGFYSAEDADSAPVAGRLKSEGAFYLWTKEEIERLLGGEAAAFLARYAVESDGNAPADPHGEFSGRNILYDTRPAQPPPAACLERLRQARARRPRPGLDDKVLASWNGLALSAFAKAAQAFGEARYLDAAVKAASFLRRHLYDTATGRLWRRWREGERAVWGTADDYAFVAQGLLDLYDAGGDPRWLEWALALTQAQQRLFGAPGGGLFMTAEDHDSRLLARVIEDSDNVEPCASSVAAGNLLRLWRLTGRDALRQAAQQTLERFGGLMRERPQALAHMSAVAETDLMKAEEIIVVGEPEHAETRALLSEARKRFRPQRALIHACAAFRPRLEALMPWLRGVAPAPGPRAYLCENHACTTPAETAQALAQRLDRV